MMMFGPIGFGAPALLLALAALPVLWWLLRSLPPVPRRQRFPGTVLLAGLEDPDPIARRTPWWLLLLRLAAVAAVILAFAQPVWRPAPPMAQGDALLIVMDAGATAAPGWESARARATREAESAIAAARPVAVLLADGQGGTDQALIWGADDAVAGALRAALPRPWPGAYPESPDAALEHAPAGSLGTIWFSDGLDHPGRAGWLEALAARGPVAVVGPAMPPVSLRMTERAARPLLELSTIGDSAPEIRALGPDPQGIPRELARLVPEAPVTRDGITTRPVPVTLPPELLGRVTRFQVDGVASAAAVVLGDDRLRRPVVALIGAAGATSETQALLSPAHFLRSALSGSARLIETGLEDALSARPDIIVLMDQVGLPPEGRLADWLDEGGLLIRFAGPRMASAPDLAAEPLLPVRLRPGGRDMGGALSWGTPRGVAPFPADGPFAGLAIPPDVTIRAQLMAEPAPDLSERSIATLEDGTPLVTRAPFGKGQVVLFHSTANADWSSLPISGLFVDMLSRLVASAGRDPAAADPGDARDGIWQAREVLDGFGRLGPADHTGPVEGTALAAGAAPGLAAGIYTSGERIAALNAGGVIEAATWPGATLEAARPQGMALTGWLLLAAAAVLILDLLGSVALRRGAVAAVLA
ncbi:MAG: BatA domain-containing protein, partial [Paracoccus sp. (in: a-proteobacteria)]|nr:BatA domain-containing protein [Paracoccus sp. (in: a-proteobacteria)]